MTFFRSLYNILSIEWIYTNVFLTRLKYKYWLPQWNVRILKMPIFWKSSSAFANLDPSRWKNILIYNSLFEQKEVWTSRTELFPFFSSGSWREKVPFLFLCFLRFSMLDVNYRSWKITIFSVSCAESQVAFEYRKIFRLYGLFCVLKIINWRVFFFWK